MNERYSYTPGTLQTPEDAARHPLYADEAMVERVTRLHVEQGKTLFQLWLAAPDEASHSDLMLDIVAPPHKATVVSLGSGVGGMEWHWKSRRPDLQFTLVNASGAQLAQSLCPGERIEQDMMSYEGGPFDVAVVSYVLGHVPARWMLHRACEMARTVLVLDIFDASLEAKLALEYDAPTSDVMPEDFEPYTLRLKDHWRLHAPLQDEAPLVQDLVRSTRPACWIRRG